MIYHQNQKMRELVRRRDLFVYPGETVVIGNISYFCKEVILSNDKIKYILKSVYGEFIFTQ